VERILPPAADDRQWTLSFPRGLRLRLIRDQAQGVISTRAVIAF